MRFAASLLLVLAAAFLSLGCTVIYVGPKAGGGSSYVTHSSDGGPLTDPRLVYISERKGDTSRPVFPSPEDYPRYVGTERGPVEYHAAPGQENSEPLGFIPEDVATRHGYLEETYGATSKTLGMGESTCSAVYSAESIGDGGKALLSIDELTRIAMERTSSAREAIQTMGSLAEKYGFYGPGSFEGAGESLVVADVNEGWLFHILPDETGTSAIWAAQRVPSDHVAVIANMFVIRNVLLNSTDDFLTSEHIAEAARKRNCVKKWPTEQIDFSGCFSHGEYAHKYYSGRRMWRAYSLLVPSLDISPEYSNLLEDHPYPVTAKMDHTITMAELRAIHRDVLEGTPFSANTGLASGPFNSPDRYTGGAGEREAKGWWERTIALHRTSDTFIIELNGARVPELQNALWYAPHAPHGSVFVPFLPVAQSVPTQYSMGHQKEVNKDTAYWAHRYLLNAAQLRYGMIMKDVSIAQEKLETGFESKLAQFNADVASGKKDISEIKAEQSVNAKLVVDTWWSLFDQVMFSHTDGWHSPSTEEFGRSPGYPKWWLEKVGYAKNEVTRLGGHRYPRAPYV